MKISISDITKVVQETLQSYTKEVTDEMEKSADRNAKKGAKKLRETSPKRTEGSKSYAAGWTKRKKGKTHTVLNRTKPQLTHLLEKGWTKRDGKKKEGTPHIKPVELEMVKDYEEDIRRAIKK